MFKRRWWEVRSSFTSSSSSEEHFLVRSNAFCFLTNECKALPLASLKSAEDIFYSMKLQNLLWSKFKNWLSKFVKFKLVAGVSSKIIILGGFWIIKQTTLFLSQKITKRPALFSLTFWKFVYSDKLQIKLMCKISTLSW